MPRAPKTFAAYLREQQCGGREASRALLEQWARDIAHSIDEQIPPKVGFCLVLFSFGDSRFSTYVSNAERESMISALEEMLDHLKAGRIMPPVGAG